jgi:hydroxypyruvate reductase
MQDAWPEHDDPPVLAGHVFRGHEPLHAIARKLFASTLADCSIEQAFTRSVSISAAADGTRTLLLSNDSVDITSCKQVRIVAIGKAARSMLQAALPRLSLPPAVDLQGILIAPASPPLPQGFQFFAGGHPLPNEASFAGARAVLDMLAAIPPSASPTPDTVCLFLISGGASAMMELPLDSTIPLDDTIAFHRALVHSGASIAEINCVRKHFSAVKGGRLATAAHRAECLSIFVSDVPSGHLDTIASGPTVPDTTTLDDCRAILARYHLLPRFPASVQRFFTDPSIPETPKPQELTARTLTLLDASDLAEAARPRAEQLGFHAVIDNNCDDWDYRAAADYLLARLRVLRRVHPRVCLISVGEVTVSSADNRLITSGVGGRNQHFALHAATRLERSDAPIAVLSAGSDGIDGNSTAAGAVVDEHTLQNAHLRSEAQTALQQFQSTAFLQSLGATITTGPTGNNLRDLRLLLAE